MGSSNDCDLKRKKAFEDKIKDYKSKKSIIQAALSNVDKPVNNKIIFDPEDDRNGQNSLRSDSVESRKQLLSDNDEDEEEISFHVKEQFEGKRGEKLFKLQQNITDKRFTLDERFVEDEDECNENDLEPENEDCNGIENEKVKEMEILSQIIGEKVKVKADKIKHNAPMKRMIRYDPENEDHTMQEAVPKSPEKKKKKRKLDVEETDETNKEPEVSKEVYYEVETDQLKNAFQESSSGFKLLDLLGDPDEEEEEPGNDGPINGCYEAPAAALNNKSSKLRNPFKYDSSDEEPEPEPKQNESENKSSASVPVVKNVLKRDPFFFKHDDYRLQEGYDFMIRMGSSKVDNYSEIRRDLKRIVKSKVKNNQRKSAPVKHKGAFARKKRMKVRKALKK